MQWTLESVTFGIGTLILPDVMLDTSLQATGMRLVLASPQRPRYS